MTIIGQAAVTRPIPVPKKRRRSVTVILAVLVVPALAWAIVRIIGWERGWLVQLLAFTPYVAAWSWLPVVLAVVARRWRVAAAAAIIALALTTLVFPRARTADQGTSQGVELRVMTSNMLGGGADAATIVRLVREKRIDVLALQELTPGGRQAWRRPAWPNCCRTPHSPTRPAPPAPGSTPASRSPRRSPGGTAAASFRRTGRSSRPAPERCTSSPCTPGPP